MAIPMILPSAATHGPARARSAWRRGNELARRCRKTCGESIVQEHPDSWYGPSAVWGHRGESRLSARGRQRLDERGARCRSSRCCCCCAVAAPGAGRVPRDEPRRERADQHAERPRLRPLRARRRAGPPTCTNTFGQQYERFGFAPNGSQATALYHNPHRPARAALHRRRTRSRAAIPLGQVPGVSADRAWKYSTGAPSVQVAILDTGIRWNNSGLRKKVALNRGELPLPQNGPAPARSTTATATAPSTSTTTRTTRACRRPPATTTSRAPTRSSTRSDLIAAFSDGTDDDATATSTTSRAGTSSTTTTTPTTPRATRAPTTTAPGRAEEAGEEGNEARGGIGVCPQLPDRADARLGHVRGRHEQLRAGRRCTRPTTTSRSSRARSAALFNSRFARKAFEYAYQQGVFFAIVSSDLNTADHNIPTLYDEAMQVQGTVADVQGLGQNPPQEFIDFFNDLGVPLGTNAPIGTWFRNSGTTQYGGHAHIVMPAVTGLGRDRPGLGRRRAGEVVRAPGGHRARAERDQAAAHDDRLGRRSRRTRSGSACPTRRSRAGTSTSATACPTSASRSSGSTRARSRRRR